MPHNTTSDENDLYNMKITITLILVLMVIFLFMNSKNEKFAPYASILIPYIRREDPSHDAGRIYM